MIEVSILLLAGLITWALFRFIELIEAGKRAWRARRNLTADKRR
jgi:hypothetical protein